MLSRYESALSGLFDLIVIVEETDDEIGRSHWASGLMSGVDVTTIAIHYPMSFNTACATRTMFNDDN